MARLLLFLVLSGTVLAALRRPWIGVVAYYVLAVFFPQVIWGWAFAGLRASVIVAGATVAGFALAALRREVDFTLLRGRQNRALVVLWAAILLSVAFGAYGWNDEVMDSNNTGYLLGFVNKAFFFYFLSVLLIDTKEKQLWLSMVVVGTTAYFTYWGNWMYLTRQMETARLAGPGMVGGVYSDENTFAMIFVVGTPFLLCLGRLAKHRVVRWAALLTIPLGWHAVFLAASRGGVLGVGVVCLALALVSRNKWMGWGLLVALVVALAWQGGRELKNRAENVVQLQQTGATADPRLDTWKAGLRMMLDHPVTGVGLGSFRRAYGQDYNVSKTEVLVAHNTTIQMGSECGVVAAFCYVFLLWNALVVYRRNRTVLAQAPGETLLAALNEASALGLLGFFATSVFLNLITYEILYCVLVVRLACERAVEELRLRARAPVILGGATA